MGSKGLQEPCVHISSQLRVRDVTPVAGNKPQWEYLCHRNWQTLQIRAFFGGGGGELVGKRLLAQHWPLLILGLPEKQPKCQLCPLTPPPLSALQPCLHALLFHLVRCKRESRRTKMHSSTQGMVQYFLLPP